MTEERKPAERPPRKEEDAETSEWPDFVLEFLRFTVFGMGKAFEFWN